MEEMRKIRSGGLQGAKSKKSDSKDYTGEKSEKSDCRDTQGKSEKSNWKHYKERVPKNHFEKITTEKR